MRTWLIALGTLCVGLVAGFFLGRGLPPGGGPAPAQTNAPGKSRDDYPTKEEVLDYLDGKAIALSDPETGSDRAAKSCTLKRSQIEGLEVARNKATPLGEPSVSAVTFLLNSDQGRYAVHGLVSYRFVQEKCAFSGFKVVEVSKQQ
jgi:hypothetical protein